MIDAGNAHCPHGQSARSQRNIEAKIADVLRAGAFPMIIGGDHSITYAIRGGARTRTPTRRGRTVTTPDPTSSTPGRPAPLHC